MNRFGSDPKVKKTLIRNCEKKVKPTTKKQVVHDASATKSKSTGSSLKENELDQPTLCSSEALAHYLSDTKLSDPPSLTVEDLNVHKGQISGKVTKKLNFHFNDRIYRNLIELNTNVENSKKKKDRKIPNATSIKRDTEPNIDDFYEEIKEKDCPPIIPVLKPKFQTIKKVESGQLHRLVAAFEDL